MQRAVGKMAWRFFLRMGSETLLLSIRHRCQAAREVQVDLCARIDVTLPPAAMAAAIDRPVVHEPPLLVKKSARKSVAPIIVSVAVD